MLTRRDMMAGALGVVAAVVRSTDGLANDAGPISPRASRLARFYDSLGVDRLWLAGQIVNWDTGEPTGQPIKNPSRHTHCSAFVASAAKRLGIYILRPPEHGPVNLANAQFDWLGGTGGATGWQSIADPVAAQAAANKGLFVVAVYRNHRDDKAGHIAIIRPAVKSPDAIALDGPEVIQAGSTNYTNSSLEQGFAGHPLAWSRGREVRFYAHEVPAGAI